PTAWRPRSIGASSRSASPSRRSASRGRWPSRSATAPRRRPSRAPSPRADRLVPSHPFAVPGPPEGRARLYAGVIPGPLSIEHRDSGSRARAGRLRLAHGEVRTPAFVPVATKAAVKTLEPAELAALGYEMVLGNA